ncbi:MAG: thioredoxin domain-containing protein [Proteobacteria bacterium]|nr:thioredoxin domain-containing protein [Pseudomonadota bacterium]
MSYRLLDLPSRRLATLLLAGAMVTGLAACGEAKKAEGGAEGDKVNVAELMKPGPLGDKVLGKDDAPVTIVEYASLTCGHCANFHTETLPKLKEKYIDTGKVRLVFREFPLDPLSTAASMITRCSTNERYFPLVTAFFQTQLDWATTEKPLDALLVMARQAGFTQESFEACLKDKAMYDGLNEVKKRGVESFSVNSTPTFFINGQRLIGNQPISEFDKVIEPLLKK